jgi:uncharacterized membrane-anchored protein
MKTIIIAVTLTLAITGTCLYFNNEQANVLCFMASLIFGWTAGFVIYHSEKWLHNSRHQANIFALVYLGLNILVWAALFRHYNSQFYEKVTRHNVVRKEVVAGYKGASRFILICEDTVIETGMQSYYSINPPQIIYHTETIR